MRFWKVMTAVAIVVVIALAVLAGVDNWLTRRSFLGQGVPVLGDPYFVLRAALAAALAIILVAGIYRARDPGSVMATATWGTAKGAPAALLSVVLAAVLGLTLVIDATIFSMLAREDAASETASAFLLLGGAGALGTAVIVLLRRPRGQRTGVVPAALLAGLLFVIGMEEISWFQRLAGVTTPDWLKEINDQHETNFHNTFTFAAEITYYLGGFTLLALLPFLADAAPRTVASSRYAAFAGGRFVVIAGAMTTMFSAKTWDITLSQMAFFGSIAALLVYAVLLARAGRKAEVWLFAGAAGVLVVIGPLTLAQHDTMIRSWDDTEIKELMLAFGLAFYAVQTAARLMNRAGMTKESGTELLSAGNIRAARS